MSTTKSGRFAGAEAATTRPPVLLVDVFAVRRNEVPQSASGVVPHGRSRDSSHRIRVKAFLGTSFHHQISSKDESATHAWVASSDYDAMFPSSIKAHRLQPPVPTKRAT